MYSALAVTAAPAVEPLALDLVKSHLRLDQDDDVLAAFYLTSARAWAEQWLNRSLITQTLRWVMAETPPTGALPLLPMPLMVLPIMLSFQQVWNRPLELPRPPLQSVSGVTVVDQDGTSTALVAGTDFLVDALIEPGVVRMISATYPTFVQHIEVDFVAGYGASGSAVPQPILQAILMMTAYFYEHRGDGDGEPPAAVEALLWPYRVMKFGG